MARVRCRLELRELLTHRQRLCRKDGIATDFKPQVESAWLARFTRAVTMKCAQLRLMKRPQGKAEPAPTAQPEKALTDKDVSAVRTFVQQTCSNTRWMLQIQRREREYAKARAEILGKGSSKPSSQPALAKRK